MDSISQPSYVGNSFSFNFKLSDSDSKDLNITQKQSSYLIYEPMDKPNSNETKECECSIENKTNTYYIKCEPKENVYTLLKKISLKIPRIQTTRRLRFLASSGNSSIYAPEEQDGDIQYVYNPDFNSFSKRYSKEKGLSKGGIAAIVLATVAAVVAVGVAFFFLNRAPVAPIKNGSTLNIQNSVTNMNN